MYRRCANGLRATGYGLRPELALLVLLALTACGSNPDMPEARSQPVVEPQPAAQVEPPGAQTFPLEPQAARSQAASAPAPETIKASKPGKSSKTAPEDAAPTVPAEPPLPPEAVQQFDSAVALAASGNVAGAEQAFRALSSAYPSYSGPLVNLGILQAKAGKLEDAEKTLKSALERKADNANAYNQLGIVHRKQGRFKEADAAYTRAVQIDPNYANAYLNLGVLCDLYLQQPQRALEAFERYLSLSSAPDDKVAAWVKELKVRLGSAQRASGAG